MDGSVPSWLSLIPALVTIGLAFATRRVVLALVLGIVSGSGVMWLEGGTLGTSEPVSRFVVPALFSASFAQILLIYLGCLGGLIGLWERTGSARHFAAELGSRIVRGPRSSLLYGWVLGCVFHQGGTVSTVLAGTAVRPVTDRHRISHEELAYVVDSTASPVATVLAFNIWPTYVGGLVVGTLPLLPDVKSAELFFWNSVPFNFYGWLAVTTTLLFSLGLLPWVGFRMAAARERARRDGALDAPGASPMLISGGAEEGRVSDYAPSLLDFTLPVAVLLGVAILPMLILGRSFANEAFMAALLTGIAIARVKGLSFRAIGTGLIDGFRGMSLGVVVIALAVTLGTVSKELGTAAFLVSLIGDAVSAVSLPVLLTVLCMLIAFATGTSWGTYAVVFPVALPLAWAVQPDPTYLQICFGAVLGGAVFGDQCSPISDTTVLSSMFTGCDLLDHVRTQIPLAGAVAAVAALLSTFAVWFFV